MGELLPTLNAMSKESTGLTYKSEQENLSRRIQDKGNTDYFWLPLSPHQKFMSFFSFTYSNRNPYSIAPFIGPFS